jgi:hypothetical protein
LVAATGFEPDAAHGTGRWTGTADARSQAATLATHRSILCLSPRRLAPGFSI